MSYKSDKVFTLEEIKKIVQPIAAQYDIDCVYLFGSYARGNATPSSDLDFRVDRGNMKSLFSLGGLYTDLTESFQKELDLVTTKSLSPQFLNQIAGEEILIYKKL